MAGSGPYKKGAAFENLTLRAYRGAGFPVVVRQPKSQSPYDLVAIRFEAEWDDRERGIYYPANRVVHLVQCKVGGYMRPAERESLKDAAREIGATPVFAWKDGDLIRRQDLRNGRDLGDFEIGADGTTEGTSTRVDQAEEVRD